MSDFMFDADTVSVGFDPAIGDSVTICTMGVEEYKRLKKCESLLRSAHEIIYDLHKYEEGDICNEVHESPCGVKVWLTAYSSLTSSKSGMGA